MLSDSYFQSWYTKVAAWSVAAKLKFFCIVSLNSESDKKKVNAVISDYF